MILIDFTLSQWIIIILSAFLIGFSKLGIPGAGFLVVPLLAGIMDARQSTGFLLPILILADIMAIIWWHKHVDVKQLIRLYIPWTFLGICLGYIILKYISSVALMPVIGVLTLLLIAVTRIISRKDLQNKLPSQLWFAMLMGMLAGATSMLANAAGPIMTIYLLSMRFEKKQFIGTNAMFFFILNLSKLPFCMNLDLVNSASLLTNLMLLPAIISGGIAALFLVNHIDQRKFEQLAMTLATAAAIFICLKPLWTN